MSKLVKFINVDAFAYKGANSDWAHLGRIYDDTIKVITDKNNVVLYIVYIEYYNGNTNLSYDIYNRNIICFNKDIYDKIVLKRSGICVMYVDNKYLIDTIRNPIDIMFIVNNKKYYSKKINTKLKL